MWKQQKCCHLISLLSSWLHIDLIEALFIISHKTDLWNCIVWLDMTQLEWLTPLLVHPLCLSAPTNMHPPLSSANCLPQLVACTVKNGIMWINDWSTSVYMGALQPVFSASHHLPWLIFNTTHLLSLFLPPTSKSLFQKSCTCHCSTHLTEKGGEMWWDVVMHSNGKQKCTEVTIWMKVTSME